MRRAVLAIVLAACGGDGKSGGAPLAEQCADLCMTTEMCSGSPNTECETKCQTQYAHIRDEFFDAFVACFVNQCTKTQEMCATEAYPAAPRRPIDDTYLNSCLARRNACSAAFSDDYCGSQLFDEAAVMTAMTCLEKPCAEISMCLRTAFN